MIRKIIGLIISCTLLISITGCNINKNKSNEKIQVVVTFNAMKEFANIIGGNKVEVTSLIQGNIEPHDFEPTSKEIKKIDGSDIFIYNGAGIDDWAEDVLKSVNNKVPVVKATEGLELIKINDSNSEHGVYDPHIWHSLKMSQGALRNIEEKLVNIDPESKEYYENNYNNAVKRMNDLYTEYEGKFNTLNNKVFVTGHEGFGYLCNDFKLRQIGIENVFASGDPSPARLKELAEICKENNVKVIFMEEQISPKLSETLAKEVGAKVEVIDNLECEGEYFSTMESNLNKIYEALK